MEKANIAIVGATGAVGVTIREILEERKFPVDNLYLLASERSAGERLMFNGKSVMVRDLADFDFSQAALFRVNMRPKQSKQAVSWLIIRLSTVMTRIFL